MRKSLRLSLILFCSVLLLVSCSNLLKDSDDTSTLTLSFNGAGLRGGARNVTPDSADTTSCWITVIISGDYTGTKTVKIDATPAESSTYQMVFDDIPVGSVIQIDANVYNQELSSTGYHKYTGSKSDVAVGEGQTDVTVLMKSMEIDYSDGMKAASVNVDGSSSSLMYTVYLCTNGKFIIQAMDDGYNKITLSEGVYEGDLTSSGTLIFKEYVYTDYSLDGSGVATVEQVYIIDTPQPTSATYGLTGTEFSGFDFTSAKGVRYYK